MPEAFHCMLLTYIDLTWEMFWFRISRFVSSFLLSSNMTSHNKTLLRNQRTQDTRIQFVLFSPFSMKWSIKCTFKNTLRCTSTTIMWGKSVSYWESTRTLTNKKKLLENQQCISYWRWFRIIDTAKESIMNKAVLNYGNVYTLLMFWNHSNRTMFVFEIPWFKLLSRKSW